MEYPMHYKSKHIARAASAVVAMGILGSTTSAFAAPQGGVSIGSYSAQSTSSSPTTLGWNQVPVHRSVSVTRAVFNQSGYQLSCSNGAMITVPFTSQNLYVMRFGVSANNTTYFVNDGTTPVLYLPQTGYLNNTLVSGARWYPFSAQFHPSQPVFLGIAPSYQDFSEITWYPNTVTYGGYYGVTAYTDGGIFQPSAGLTFYIGTQPYRGWSAYRDHVRRYPRNNVARYDRRDNDNSYNNRNDGYRGNGYGYPNGGYGYPGGGNAYGGGGYGFSNNNANQNQTPNPPATGQQFNRPGPTFDRAGPRFDGMMPGSNGFGFGFGGYGSFNGGNASGFGSGYRITPGQPVNGNGQNTVQRVPAPRTNNGTGIQYPKNPGFF